MTFLTIPRTAGVFSRILLAPTLRRPRPITFRRWLSLHAMVLCFKVTFKRSMRPSLGRRTDDGRRPNGVVRKDLLDVLSGSRSVLLRRLELLERVERRPDH